MVCNPTCNHRVSTDRAAQGAEFLSLGWWGSIVYITSSRRTVQLGWMQGVYERFPLQKLIRYTPATQAGLYRGGPLYLYLQYSMLATLEKATLIGQQVDYAVGIG